MKTRHSVSKETNMSEHIEKCSKCKSILVGEDCDKVHRRCDVCGHIWGWGIPYVKPYDIVPHNVKRPNFVVGTPHFGPQPKA